MHLKQTAQATHELESEIAEYIKNQIPDPQIFRVLLRRERVMDALASEIKMIQGMLGKRYDYFKGGFVVRERNFREVRSLLAKQLSGSERILALKYLDRLKNKDLSSLLEEYETYIQEIAKSKDIEVKLNFQMEVYPVPVDEFRPFIRALAQVFRNIIAHGIEPVTERIKAGKSEVATITMRGTYGKSFNGYLLEISDDGRGVNMEAINGRAIRMGYKPNELNEEQALELLFSDSFTTMDETTQLAGRGVGLALLRQATEQLGGSVSLASKALEGTTYSFLLPHLYHEDYHSGMEKLRSTVFASLKSFSMGYFGDTASEWQDDYDMNPIQEKAYTAFLRLRGEFDIWVGLSAMHEFFAERIMYELGMKREQIKDEMIEDGAQELLNILCGAVLGELENSNMAFQMGELSAFYGSELGWSFRGMRLYSQCLNFETGRKLSFFVLCPERDYIFRL
jgi:signal transduction histidine kinase